MLERAHHIYHLVTDTSCNKKDESETKFIQAETVNSMQQKASDHWVSFRRMLPGKEVCFV